MNLPKNEFRMSITSGCNMKCVYCHNEGNKKPAILSINDIEKIIKASHNLGLEEIRLTGGDPLTHPNIYEICDMIYNKYHLRISINTNCVEFEKLEKLIDNGWISRVVVGLDYYDETISKKSPIGVSSKVILERILKIKEKNCDVSIATVFNNDYENKKKMVKWCIDNGIRVKIIEIERNEICSHSDNDFLNMRSKIISDFDFDKVYIDDLNEYNCVINNKKIVSFFPSLCRIRRCDICKKIQLRITSSGIIKQCLYYDDLDESITDSNCDEINQKLVKMLNNEVNYHIEDRLRIV